MTSLLLIKSMLFANALQKSHKKKKQKLKKTSSVLYRSVKNVASNLCRICNEERGVIPIFNNIVHPEIPEEIKNFSGVIVSKEDSVSNTMCQNCLDLLNGCIMFREMCQMSNRKITQQIVKEEPKTKRSIYERDKTFEGDSDESYNIASPTFSDDNAEIWSCSSCNKDFENMDLYNKHLSKCLDNLQVPEAKKSRAEKKIFLCDTCGKTAYSNAGLLVHMLTHENIFPYKCDLCPYQGRTMDLLKVHKRSHMAEKPFKCTLCPKASTTSSNLMKHMRHVHSTTRPFKCSYCEKAFSYQHDMKRHIKDIHLRQGTVECDVCYKKFNTRKILQGHRLKIHKIKGERQGRLPAYLQCQMDPRISNSHQPEQNEENVNECEPLY